MANLKKSTVGGGCFWCVEAVMQRIKGVAKVESGYAGGESENPTYKEICTGNSGHAEVVQITFDADIISLSDLLTIFMTTHDPTKMNRQGADVGTQYRSVIYYHDAEQKAIAEQVIHIVQPHYDDKIVTELSPVPTFYKAEDYHQNYYNTNPTAGYCYAVISPKVAKLKKYFADKIE